MSNIYTIGFTKKDAKTFFTLLRNSGAKLLVDVRLNNVSQLAGYAKRDDLKFFLKEICNINYEHAPELAPTATMLKSYRNGGISWEEYEESFLNLMAKRNIERNFNAKTLDSSCLLCSEHEPHFCHRRLVVDYLNNTIKSNINVMHLF